MQVLTDLKRGLWPHTGCRQKISLILLILLILKILLKNPARKSCSKKAALRHPMNINIIILTPRITPNDDGFPFTGRNRLW